MFENPRRGRQGRNFTTTAPKILDLKSPSEQILFRNCRWVPLFYLEDEIPSVSVPNFEVLQLGENITVFCKMTEGKEASSRTELIRISWYKDGVLQQTLRNPDPTNPQDTLGALILANDRSENGGNYTCLLEVLLRSIKLHSVSDSTIIESTLMVYLNRKFHHS